jgi:hypothetical protein
MMMHISNSYILTAADREQFVIFRRPGPEDETVQGLMIGKSPPQLQLAFSGVYPSRFRDTGCLLPERSPVIIGTALSDFESPSKIHLMFAEDFGAEGSTRNEYIEIMGSIRGFALRIPPSTQAWYTLGMASTTKFKESHIPGSMEKEDNYFYALRLEGMNPDRDSTGTHLTAIKLDLSPWVDADENYTHIVDFNPFTGTALLSGPESPVDGPFSQSIIVLDFLCTTD